MQKLIPFVLLIAGEALAIYAEMYIAGIRGNLKFLSAQAMIALMLMTIAGILLLFGYYVGYKVFSDIWIITVISITTIVIIEPILALALFRELPSKGTIIGFILGSVGLFATLYR